MQSRKIFDFSKKCHEINWKSVKTTQNIKNVNLFQIVFWSHCTLLFNTQRQILFRVPYPKSNNILNNRFSNKKTLSTLFKPLNVIRLHIWLHYNLIFFRLTLGPKNLVGPKDLTLKICLHSQGLNCNSGVLSRIFWDIFKNISAAIFKVKPNRYKLLNQKARSNISVLKHWSWARWLIGKSSAWHSEGPGFESRQGRE